MDYSKPQPVGQREVARLDADRLEMKAAITKTEDAAGLGAAELERAVAARVGQHPGKECGCPPWVVRCAHFDGKTLWLVDSDLFPAELLDDGSHIKTPYRYAAVSGVIHNCACERHVKVTVRHLDSDSLTHAQAEFARREAALLEPRDA